MSKFFITGGMGFVGSYVVRRLLELGHDLMIYDSFIQYVMPEGYDVYANPYYRLKDVLNKVQIVRGGITNVNMVRKTLYEYEPEYLIHLASMPLANLANESPEEAFNSILYGTNNLIQLLQNLSSLKKMVYISSSMVYGDFKYTPVDEDHPKNPKGVYGALKHCSEIIVQSFSKLHGIDYTIVRPTAVYGPFDGNRRVLRIFLENALLGKPIIVKGADVQLDFTYAEDTAEGIVLAALSPQTSGQIFNISRGEGRSLAEGAKIISRLIPGTKIEYVQPDKAYPRRGALNIEKARKILNFSPRYTLEEGLGKYFQFLKEYHK